MSSRSILTNTRGARSSHAHGKFRLAKFRPDTTMIRNIILFVRVCPPWPEAFPGDGRLKSAKLERWEYEAPTTLDLARANKLIQEVFGVTEFITVRRRNSNGRMITSKIPDRKNSVRYRALKVTHEFVE